MVTTSATTTTAARSPPTGSNRRRPKSATAGSVSGWSAGSTASATTAETALGIAASKNSSSHDATWSTSPPSKGPHAAPTDTAVVWPPIARPTLLGREHGDDHRRHDRLDQSVAHRHDHTSSDEREERRCEPDEHRADAEDHQTGDVDPATTDSVGHAPHREQQCAHDQRVDDHHPANRSKRDAEVGRDGVEHHEHHRAGEDQRGQRQRDRREREPFPRWPVRHCAQRSRAQATFPGRTTGITWGRV